MKSKTFGAVSAITLAGLQIDLLQKMRDGKISVIELEGFLNMKPQKRKEIFGIIPEYTLLGLLAEWRDTARQYIPDVVFYYNNELCSDPDILAQCANAEISSRPIPTGTYSMIPVGTSRREQEIYDEAVAGNAIVDDIGIALRMHIASLQQGVFNKKETYRCIFFKHGNIVRELWCDRYSDGKLYLNVSEVSPVYVLRAPDEFFCSNNEN